MSKVLVTGGAGFIGSHLVDRLLEDGHEVVILDNLTTGSRENVNVKAKFIEVDIQNFENIAPYFSGCEVVFHAAAQARIQPSIQNPLPPNDTNITGTLNVLWASYKAGVKKVIYSASSSVYGDQDTLPLQEEMVPRPKNPYAVQKLTGEMYAKLFSDLYGLATVNLRYFNVYGPRQLVDGPYATVIGIFLKQIKDNQPMTIVGDGEIRRDFTYITDVVEANMLAWKKEVSSGDIINIGTGKNFSINEVATLISGPTINIPFRLGETSITLADIQKAKRLLDWVPRISLEQGIEELKKIQGIV